MIATQLRKGLPICLGALMLVTAWVIGGRDRGPVAVAAIAVFFFVFVSTTVGLGAASAAWSTLGTAAAAYLLGAAAGLIAASLATRARILAGWCERSVHRRWS